jgi:predicted phage terminase large subunit-like protein
MKTLAATEIARLVAALCRSDFASFVRKVFYILAPHGSLHANFHIYAMAYHLELVRRGIIRRLIICLPPRSLKSIVASVAFPAFVHGHDPSKRIIGASYNFDLATSLSNQYRTVLKSLEFEQFFPLTRIKKDTEREIVTTANGFRVAASVEAALTGRGCDIAIIDDPLSSVDALSESRRRYVNDWYHANFPMRLDDKRTGAIIIVMQRLHYDDLVGQLLRPGERWTVLKLPAIAEEKQKIPIGPGVFHMRRCGDVLHPERESLSELESTRTLKPEIFAAQYQQSPVPPGGFMIKRQWIRRYDALPERTPSSIDIQSWDTAAKDGAENDWSACSTWRIIDGKYYLIDVLRQRLDYPALRARAITHARRCNIQKLLVEDIGIGTALIQELRNAGLPVVAVKPEHNKKTRMSIQSAKFVDGLVFLPRQAYWLAEFEAKLLSFPYAHFDDQVDCTAQALATTDSVYDARAIGEGMERFAAAMVLDGLARRRFILR